MQRDHLNPSRIRRWRSVLLAAAFVLAIVSIGNSATLRQGSTQPMAILGGTEVYFESGGTQRVPAYCTNENLKEPYRGVPFDHFSGRVTITFKDGRSLPVDIDKAGVYFSMEGTGRFDSIVIKAKDASVAKVTFNGAAMAQNGTDSAFATAKNYLPTFERLTAEETPVSVGRTSVPVNEAAFFRTRQIVKNVLWKNPWALSTSSSQSGKTTTYEHVNRDAQNTLTQTVLNLDSQGDAILLKTPGGENILIDSGLTNEALKRIMNQLPRDVSVNIILTHPDADHIANTFRILKDGGVSVDNIIMSSWENKTKTLDKLKELLAEQKYTKTDLKNSPASIYSKKPAAELPLTDVAANTSPSGVVIEPDIKALYTEEELNQIDSNPAASPFAIYALKGDKGVDIKIIQLKKPGSSNDSSLISRVTHKGVATLYTGDISDKVMKEFVAYYDRMNDSSVMPALYLYEEAKYIQAFAATFPEKYSQLKTKYLGSIEPRTTNVERTRLREAFIDEAYDYADMSGGHRGQAILKDLEDEGYLTSINGGLRIQSQFLKWPHHAWLGRNTGARETLKRFIEIVNPDTILFSVSPQGIRGQDLVEVRRFLNESFPGRRFDIRTTPEDGHIKTWTFYKKRPKPARGDSTGDR